MSKILNKIYSYIIAHSLIFFIIGCCALLLIPSDIYAASADYVKHCGKEAIEKEYEEGGCWSCYVILKLMASMMVAVNSLSGPILELSKIIVVLGAAVWYGVYFLKSVGSLATQDPVKIIDGALVFGFKIALVYTLLSAGIDTIVTRIVNPLLSIGLEIGSTFAAIIGG